MSKEINERQKRILKVVIDKYIVEHESISSLALVKTPELSKWSSATIRNDMVVLEERGYLKKEYFSSGKIPTKTGYRFYIESLMKGFNGSNDIKQRLIDIFSNRHESADQVIDKCANLISEFLNLPTVLIKAKRFEKECLRKIDIVNIHKSKHIIYLVTSSGEIIKDVIFIDDEERREDLLAAVRLLNEELINLTIEDINSKLPGILILLKKKVHQFEFVYESIITQMIINKLLKKQDVIPKIYNSKSLIYQPEVLKNQLDIGEIFNLLENYSTFSPINYNYLKTGNTLFHLNEEEGITVATVNLVPYQIAVIGPIRMNYPLIKYLFDFLSEKLNLDLKL